MNNDELMNFDRAARLLDEHEVMASPAEMHGVVCGLICGGISSDKAVWQDEFNDLVNDGFGFAPPVRQWLESLFDATLNALCQQSGLELLLPEEDEPLDERLESLADWTQAFLAGFAVRQQDLSRLSEELQEMITDLSNITQLDSEFEEDSENEASYLVLYEHLRLAVMMAFEELGQRPREEKAPTLH